MFQQTLPSVASTLAQNVKRGRAPHGTRTCASTRDAHIFCASTIARTCACALNRSARFKFRSFSLTRTTCPPFLAPFACALLLLLASCSAPRLSGEVLDGERLFSLSVGKLENNLDYFQRGGSIPAQNNSLYMSDGIIYIANSLGRKVMEFSSYGDLITLIYNEEHNPRPVLLSQQSEENRQINKKAEAFPFIRIGEVLVDSNNAILVSDHIPPGREDYDQETGTVLRSIVHRFTANGRYIDFIGQEGIGGTPFAYIVSMALTERDDLVVLTRDGSAHRVFWFNANAERLFTVMLDESRLPAGRDPQSIPNIASVFPDRNAYRLYLHINFESMNSLESESRIFVFDLASGLYSDSFELSRNIQTLPNDEGLESIEYKFTFLGLTAAGNLYFISRRTAQEQLLIILDSSGNLRARRILQIENPSIIFSDYHVSSNGIITALVSSHSQSDVYWWRVDRLLGRF